MENQSDMKPIFKGPAKIRRDSYQPIKPRNEELEQILKEVIEAEYLDKIVEDPRLQKKLNLWTRSEVDILLELVWEVAKKNENYIDISFLLEACLGEEMSL